MEKLIYNKIINQLANFVEVEFSKFDMTANLEEEYDIDSTELTDLAKILEKEFDVKINKSEIDNWESGNSIFNFITKNTSM